MNPELRSLDVLTVFTGNKTAWRRSVAVIYPCGNFIRIESATENPSARRYVALVLHRFVYHGD
jgi:hypothetical protein